LGAVGGRLGRSQAPQPLVSLGIAGPGGAARLLPLHGAAVWAVPGDGPARAGVYGSGVSGDGEQTAVELIGGGAGRVLWRAVAAGAAPVVGATADVIVCGDAGGTRAIGVDGAPRWSTGAPFVAFTGERVAVSQPGALVVLDAGDGSQRAQLALP